MGGLYACVRACVRACVSWGGRLGGWVGGEGAVQQLSQQIACLYLQEAGFLQTPTWTLALVLLFFLLCSLAFERVSVHESCR